MVRQGRVTKRMERTFQSRGQKGFPQKYSDIINALLFLFDKFHNPIDVTDAETGQAKAICSYVPNYRYPKSEKWFVTADKYPENLKELFKVRFECSCGETTCLIDKLCNINDVLQEAKKKIKSDIMMYNKWVKIKNQSRIKGHYSYSNVAMELLRQQVISELLEKESS